MKKGENNLPKSIMNLPFKTNLKINYFHAIKPVRDVHREGARSRAGIAFRHSSKI
jgi:hypothetical protein